MSTIYRKYRPKRFSEISGQVHVVHTLTNAILHERIGHAYLFTGPRGTGKTTLARIFAKTINCLEPIKQKKNSEIGIEPCNKCKNCKLILSDKAMDLIEIDAASHTGVDNIRQLKETIPLPPTALKYKVYIIDEVHMLSIGAFNALLKTLEEPPTHAIFILATTELHKVPETIVSRCQRFDISNLSIKQIIERLGQIAKAEKVEIENEALETIALEAEGGMRDAESLFGQILSLEDKKITAQETHEILGTSPRVLVIDFAHNLLKKNISDCLKKIDKMEHDGVNLKNFNKLLLVYLRNLLLLKVSARQNTPSIDSLTQEQLAKANEELQHVSAASLVFLLELFQKSIARFKESTIPQLPLELAAIEFSLEGFEKKETKQSTTPQVQTQKEKMPFPSSQQSIETNAAEKIAPHIHENENKAQEKVDESSTNTTQVQTNPEPPEKEQPIQPAKKFDKTLGDILEHWTDILEQVKPHNHSISAFLKNCTPCGIKNDTLYIKTKYDFYKDKLSEISNRLTVEKVIATIMNASIKIAFITEKECGIIDFDKQETSSEDHNPLHDAMQVFGGRIVK